MFSSLAAGRYNMVMNVYRQRRVKQDRTGQLVRCWILETIPNPAKVDPDDLKPYCLENPDFKLKNIPCIARGIQGQGIRVVGSTERMEAGNYQNVEWVKIQTQYNLSKRDRIGYIRAVDEFGREQRAWSDIERVSKERAEELRDCVPGTEIKDIGGGEWEADIPIRFEVLGATPIMDPFGNIIEYDVLAEFAENQMWDFDDRCEVEVEGAEPTAPPVYDEEPSQW